MRSFGMATSRKLFQVSAPLLLACFALMAANAQTFRVQCPTSTITHPDPTNAGLNNSEPAYNGPTQFTRPTTGSAQWVVPTAGTVNGAIKCQQISGGDGYMTEADGTQTFMFSFGPLSGLADIAAGAPGTEYPYVFNTPFSAVSNVPLTRGDPATTDGATSGALPWTDAPGPFIPTFTWNGAVGLTPDISTLVNVANLLEGPFPPS